VLATPAELVTCMITKNVEGRKRSNLNKTPARFMF